MIETSSGNDLEVNDSFSYTRLQHMPEWDALDLLRIEQDPRVDVDVGCSPSVKIPQACSLLHNRRHEQHDVPQQVPFTLSGS